MIILWLLKLGITMLIHNKDDIKFVTEFHVFWDTLYPTQQKANLNLIAIIHTFSKQYKNSCKFFACKIITFMCIFSYKLYLI